VGAEDIADRGGEGGQGERRSAGLVGRPEVPVLRQHRDRGSLGGEPPRDCGADSAAAAGDQGRLTLRLDVDVIALPVLSLSLALVRYHYYCRHTAAPMTAATGAKSLRGQMAGAEGGERSAAQAPMRPGRRRSGSATLA
jgi:hypothetical protein